MNLFDIMRNAGGGNPFEAFGRPYGLSEDQVSRALAAFLPAFSSGLKRSVADPASLFELMRRFGMEQFAAYYRNPAAAAERRRGDGQDLLALLFGSNEATRAMAEQASALTGISEQTLREMFPAFAATLFGGLQRQSFAANPALAAMVRQFAGAPARPSAAPTQSAKGPLDRYEAEQEDAARREAADHPLQHLQSEAVRSAFTSMTAGAASWAEMLDRMAQAAIEPGGNPPPATPPLPDLFGDMLEPGLRLGEAYQRNIDAILDRQKPSG